MRFFLLLLHYYFFFVVVVCDDVVMVLRAYKLPACYIYVVAIICVLLCTESNARLCELGETYGRAFIIRMRENT